MDLTFAVAAVIFTLLAIVAATFLLSGSRSAASVCSGQRLKGSAAGRDQPEPEHNGHLPREKENEEPTESLDFSDDMESDSDSSIKYVPGKARSHHLEKMMSQEELDQEKRVQQEQLAAIFQLLRDNKDTFGDVSEGDMEEQLKLYSI